MKQPSALLLMLSSMLVKISSLQVGALLKMLILVILFLLMLLLLLDSLSRKQQSIYPFLWWDPNQYITTHLLFILLKYIGPNNLCMMYLLAGNGKVGHVNQANNMYLFPGFVLKVTLQQALFFQYCTRLTCLIWFRIGLGSLLSGAHYISDGMLQAAAEWYNILFWHLTFRDCISILRYLL